MTLSKVDLPAPFGPTSATNSPREISAVIPLSTSEAAYPNDKLLSAMTDCIVGAEAPPKVLPQTPILSNRIRLMPENRERYLFALTLSSAAAVLVSIAAAETLLAITCLVWIVVRPRPLIWPSYFTPLCAFMVTTAFSLAMSPEPAFGRAAIYKFWLFSMSLLATNFINTP